MLDIKQYLSGWEARYKYDLTQNILPFWLKHGWDRENGGVYTCLDRDGSLMDPTKSVWFQGRFAFVCAFAYNNVAPFPAWLEASRSALDFIEAHCFDKDGRMYFEVTADGKPLRKRRYVFSESFAIIAMAEYAKATGDETYARKALDSDPVLDERISRSVALLRDCFMHPEFKALLETVGPNGEFIDTNNGRTINPGHCIETAWFLLDEARQRGDDALRAMALQILDWSWKWGWDEQYGGIINFRDCKGLPSQDYSQDMKFWWPQTEAVIATLCAYRDTGDLKYLAWHRMASEWAYAHFPDEEYGEWFGYLHRDGTVAQTAKGNLFKGPFHIPRMMVCGYKLCRTILGED